ncbi:MAG: SDR family oxidoreductase [Desulfobacteraceae bacterium]|nr:MAG: SDR family oxidoreductase [Desulfobacteraceae bacterium]
MLENKIAWITGAGSGIGLAGAQALAAAGARVVMSGRRANVLSAEADKIRKAGGTAEAEPLDVGDAAAVERAAQEIARRLGKIDILVNSAGTNSTRRFWRDQTIDGWDQVIRVNLNGTFYCTRAALPIMRSSKQGLVINISSWAGVYTSALVGPAYNSSKHALVSLTETINMEECANGIRACVICPAEVDTPILDRRPMPPPAEERTRMLRPEDLGRAIRWVSEQPPHVCVNQIVISPTWNRLFIGSGPA